MLGASIVVLASVVLGLGALVASDALRLESAPGPALADRATTTSTRTHHESRLCRSNLSPDDALRLWIAGDSLAGSLGPSLGERAAETGIVQPVYDSRVSSGLSSPEFFDWPEHATKEMTRLDPEVVVFIIGANDWKTPSSGSSDSASWQGEYRLRVEEVLRILEDGGDTRHVYWVGAPTMQDRRKDQGVQRVNTVAREVVGQHDRAEYVDAYELFSGAEGGFTPTLPGSSGKSVRVRAGDGVHFTVEGGDLLGDAVYARLERRCALAEHAVPDQAKTVIRTRGSDGPTGAPGSPGGASTNTTASTAPPPTAAPVPAPPPASAPEPGPDTTATTESPTMPPSGDVQEPSEP